MKAVFMIMGLFVLTLISGIVFLFIGITIGGNFFTEFELFGTRGYEATGNLGFIVGIILGLVFSVIVIIMNLKKDEETE